MKAQKGRRGITLFPSTLVLEGAECLIPCSGPCTPRNDTVPIVQEADWAPGLVWTVAQNALPSWIQSLDSPVCSSFTSWFPGFLVVSFEIDNISIGKQVSGSFFVREEGKVNTTCSFITKNR